MVRFVAKKRQSEIGSLGSKSGLRPVFVLKSGRKESSKHGGYRGKDPITR